MRDMIFLTNLLYQAEEKLNFKQEIIDLQKELIEGQKEHIALLEKALREGKQS